jgi:hypothetical protein
MKLHKPKLAPVTVTFGYTDPTNILGPCPPRGQRNKSLMGAALKLKSAMYDANEAHHALESWLTRDPEPGEIERVLGKVYEDDEGYIRYRPKEEEVIPAELDPDVIFEAYQEFGGIRELVSLPDNELSIDPEGANIEQLTTREWLWQLYEPDDLLCVGHWMTSTKVRPLKEWNNRLLYYAALLSPCIFEKKWKRCDLNVRSLPYFVLEFDYEISNPELWALAARYGIEYDREACKLFFLDLQAAVIMHLMKIGLPVVSVIYSGGKSLHCWCANIRGWFTPEFLPERFYAQMCAFGVDAHGATASQFMRIANPYRPERRQPILYHNTQYLNR